MIIMMRKQALFAGRAHCGESAQPLLLYTLSLLVHRNALSLLPSFVCSLLAAVCFSLLVAALQHLHQ